MFFRKKYGDQLEFPGVGGEGFANQKNPGGRGYLYFLGLHNTDKYINIPLDRHQINL